MYFSFQGFSFGFSQLFIELLLACCYLPVQEFAGEGLRTLALAFKDLDEEYFTQWQQRHHVASTELEDRESKLDELYEEIEKDLLVGTDRTEQEKILNRV